MAGFIKKGVNFARAYTRWVAAGKPLRDDDYIIHLYDDHCSKCPLFIKFKEGVGECDECGCRVKRVSASKDTLNKLAWPTEECPEGHWDADVDEPEDNDT